MESGLLDTNGKPILGRPANIFGIRRPDDKRVEKMEWRPANGLTPAMTRSPSSIRLPRG